RRGQLKHLPPLHRVGRHLLQGPLAVCAVSRDMRNHLVGGGDQRQGLAGMSQLSPRLPPTLAPLTARPPLQPVAHRRPAHRRPAHRRAATTARWTRTSLAQQPGGARAVTAVPNLPPALPALSARWPAGARARSVGPWPERAGQARPVGVFHRWHRTAPYVSISE